VAVAGKEGPVDRGWCAVNAERAFFCSLIRGARGPPFSTMNSKLGEYR
jgi:hypothetical protein